MTQEETLSSFQGVATPLQTPSASRQLQQSFGNSVHTAEHRQKTGLLRESEDRSPAGKEQAADLVAVLRRATYTSHVLGTPNGDAFVPTHSKKVTSSANPRD